MRDYKKFTSVRIIRQAKVEKRKDLLAAFEYAGEITGRSDHKLWEDSYWNALVFSQRVLKEKLHYMHRNPVRAGLVREVQEYPYSSYRNYVCDDHSLIQIDSDWL